MGCSLVIERRAWRSIYDFVQLVNGFIEGKGEFDE
jgi:hypothetical protein